MRTNKKNMHLFLLGPGRLQVEHDKKWHNKFSADEKSVNCTGETLFDKAKVRRIIECNSDCHGKVRSYL